MLLTAANMRCQDALVVNQEDLLVHLPIKVYKLLMKTEKNLSFDRNLSPNPLYAR